MAGKVVEWFWMAKCHRNCWNSVAESYLGRTRYARQFKAEALHILQLSAFLSYVQFEPGHAVTSEQ